MAQKSAVAARAPKKRRPPGRNVTGLRHISLSPRLPSASWYFTFGRFFQNIWFSFNDVNKFNMSTFVGLENYINLFSDKEVWKAFGNSLKYVVITVPAGLFLSIFIAALMNAKIRGKSIYRTLYFLPSVTMSAAVARYGNGSTMSRWVS